MCLKFYLAHLFFTKGSLLWNSDQLVPYFFSLITIDMILDTLDIFFYLGLISYLSN